MAEITIHLRKPLYNGTVTEVRLREPTAAEYIEIGDINQYGRSPDGSIYEIEVDGVARRYFERLITYPMLPQARQLSLVDAMAVKDAIVGFFDAARQESQSPATSLAPQTTSESSATH